MVSMSACNLIITGFVQGVFFRAETKRVANELGIKGWVGNNPDGSVEIHAEGIGDQLSKLEAWCRQGPPNAQVEAVTKTAAPNEQCTSFEIHR